jgi:hypothetical protein
MTFSGFMAPGTVTAHGHRNMPLMMLTQCHSEPHVDLVQLLTSTSPRFHYDEAIRLIGAHGEEIVRSVYVDELVSLSGTASAEKGF